MINKIFRMKRLTKVGCLAASVVLLVGLWFVIGQKAGAEEYNGFDYDEVNGNVIINSYTGDAKQLVPADFPGGGSRVITIKANAFANTGIREIAIPTTVTTIENGAFFNCKDLQMISISGCNGLTVISDNTFAGCEKLINVSLPAHVTTIGSGAFADCKSMTSFTIREDIVSIADDAFAGCDNLVQFASQMGEVSEVYGVSNNLEYNSDFTVLIQVPNGLATLSASDFDPRCNTIATGAFSNNTVLTDLTLPSTIKTVQDGAFSNCHIVTMTVPSSVNYFGSQSNWNTLETMYCYANSAAYNFALTHTRNVNGVTDRTNIITVGDAGGNQNQNQDPNNTGNNNTNPGTTAPGNTNTSTSNNNSYNTNDSNNTTSGDTTSGNNTNSNTSQSSPNITINNNANSGNDGSGSTGSTTGNNVTNAANSSGKDSTPKTADGDIDGRWFAILGVFLAGIALIFFSRFRKMEYVSSNTKKKSDLDS